MTGGTVSSILARRGLPKLVGTDRWRYLHLHVVIRTGQVEEGVHCGGRPLVDLHYLGEKHVHAGPERLPAAERTDSLWGGAREAAALGGERGPGGGRGCGPTPSQR